MTKKQFPASDIGKDQTILGFVGVQDVSDLRSSSPELQMITKIKRGCSHTTEGDREKQRNLVAEPRLTALIWSTRFFEGASTS
jgi:hypothetical protein